MVIRGDIQLRTNARTIKMFQVDPRRSRVTEVADYVLIVAGLCHPFHSLTFTLVLLRTYMPQNQGSRQNLVYNRNGEIVYPAACAGVVMTKRTKPQSHRQAYNLDHTQVGFWSE